MNMTHAGKTYIFSLTPISEGDTRLYLGYPIIARSLVPVGLVMVIENQAGDTYRIRAEFHEECFIFYDVKGSIIGEWVLYEPEYLEPEYEKLTDTPAEAREYLRKAWRYSDRMGEI